MFKLNQVVLAGNITREIDLKYTGNQRAYARFSVAVNRAVKQNDGSYKDVADFIPIAVWGKTAENCQRFLKKGDNVLINGRISTRSYESNGEKRFVVEVLADQVQFPPRNGNSNGYGNGYSNQNVPSQRNGYSTETQKNDRPNDWNPIAAEGFSAGDGESPIPF